MEGNEIKHIQPCNKLLTQSVIVSVISLKIIEVITETSAVTQSPEGK